MPVPTHIKFQGRTYRLADAETSSDVTKHSFRHWSFTVQDHLVTSLVDDLQVSGNGAPEKLPVEGLLAFLGRMVRSQYEADVEAAGELYDLLASDSVVKEAFTNTLHHLRNNYAALDTLFHCILFGPLAGGQNDGLKQLPKQQLQARLNELISNSGQYFDFSNIDTFLSSFAVLPTAVLSPEV
jgi:hypothetical protein